ncbi:MAG: GldG family protein [Myxococcota bacterium]
MRRALLWHGWAQTALWALLAVLVVHLAQAWPVRLDLTRDGRYGLSDAARAAVADLERPLSAEVFFTDPLDPPYHAHREALLDLLDDLSAASRGQLSVRVVDPTGDPALQAEAAALGVPAIPYAVRTRERAEARTVYMGVALTYGDRHLAVGALPSIGTMEIELVRAIRALTTPPDRATSIGWWLGHGEPDPTTAEAGSPLRTLAAQLAQRGPFRTVAPGDAPIPDDVDLLLIVAPRRPVPPAEQVQLDQFVMRGGRVLAFLSSFQPDFERGQPVPVDHGLFAWLGAYGVQLGRDLLVDRVHDEVLPVPIGGRWVKVNSPAGPGHHRARARRARRAQPAAAGAALRELAAARAAGGGRGRGLGAHRARGGRAEGPRDARPGGAAGEAVVGAARAVPGGGRAVGPPAEPVRRAAAAPAHRPGGGAVRARRDRGREPADPGGGGLVGGRRGERPRPPWPPWIGSATTTCWWAALARGGRASSLVLAAPSPGVAGRAPAAGGAAAARAGRDRRAGGAEGTVSAAAQTRGGRWSRCWPWARWTPARAGGAGRR